MPHPFCTAVTRNLQVTAERLAACIDMVEEDLLWVDFAPNLSSPGNLVLHLVGNLSQYVLRTLGGNPYLRERAKEFSLKPEIDRDALKAMLREAVNQCIVIIGGLGEEDLLTIYTVQGNERSGYDILLQVSEHFSYHTGQFAWFCKYLFQGDIDFYRGRDLNIQ
ncbi:MAG: DinB family protein [Chlorobiaceae bacterium]|nr:DinB family protein [Chlorobiaceae bacterium]